MALEWGSPAGHHWSMTTTATALLSRTWFAADMPADVCGRMAAIADVVDIPSGGIVVQEGLACRSLGVVLSGRIALRLTVPGLGDRTLVTVDEGRRATESALPRSRHWRPWSSARR
jgi:hypothetical protein